MASTQGLKSRIRSVNNTKQITKAMQLVAASKMRRAQEADKASAPYVAAATEVLNYLASQGATDTHPLFAVRPVRSRLLIVIAADKGLAGAYNGNVTKAYLRELKADDELHIKNETIAVGRRIAQFASKLSDTEIVGVYQELPDKPSGRELHAILDTAIDKFTSGAVDAVDIIYTQFVNSLKQQAVVQRILPGGADTTAPVSEFVRDAKYEPNAEEVLDGVTSRLVGAQIFQALLDARASEHSMRMVAMKSATDNANNLAADLTLAMNKARQAAVTQEIAEISGGVEALNNA